MVMTNADATHIAHHQTNHYHIFSSIHFIIVYFNGIIFDKLI